MNHSTNRSIIRGLKRWGPVAVVSAPVVAILQGAILLYDYRTKHGNAPRPDVPSRGIVVAQESSTTTSRSTLRVWPLRQTQQKQPLRLLVIGDSLAAGVGIRESSSPILPQQIATELSKAMGGRPVYWTCVGEPGISSSLLVEEIYQLKEDRFERPMIQRWTEWQAKRAQARIEAAKREAQDWLDHRNDDDNRVDDGETEKIHRRNDMSVHPVERWFRQRAFQIKRDANGIVRVIKSLDLRRNKIDDDIVVSGESGKQGSQLKRHASIDPAVVGHYDIAVVLTGLNDLKDAFLPFMMSAQRKRKLKEANADQGVLNSLLGIVLALEDKMPFRVPYKDTSHSGRETTTDDPLSTDESEKSECRQTLAEALTQDKMSQRKQEIPEHAPLVVFPALPINPIEMSQVAPLNWFLKPIIHAMDQHKKALAEMFPGLVLFVESPSNKVLSDVEHKRGPLWESSQNEDVLLRLNDVVQTARDRVEYLMRQHYHSWFADQGDGDEHDREDSLMNATLYEMEAFGVCLTTLPRKSRNEYPGSTMVSCDGVHPSDFGYDFWGRFIAAAIIKELKL